MAILVVAGAIYYLFPMTQAPAGQESAPAQNTSDLAGEREQMAGTWRSQTDASFTREMRVDGVIIDRYEGDATAGINGEWSIVSAGSDPLLLSRSAGLTSLDFIVKASWEDGAEITYFGVTELSDRSMTIVDLSGRGGTTMFAKI